MSKFSKESEQFIIEKAVEGYEPEEIRLLMKEEMDLPMLPKEESFVNFLESEEAQEKIETKRSVKQKKAEISQEDLLGTLVDLKNDLENWHEELKDTEHGVTRNEAIGNMIDTVNKIGELIGELDRSSGVAGNVVKIDEMHSHLQQEITQVVPHLSRDKKEELVQALKESDEVESFAIKWADQEKEEEQEGAKAQSQTS